MRHRLFATCLLAAAAAITPLSAQAPRGMMPEMLTGSGGPSDVKPGTYSVEPDHTQVAFSVSHLGISPFAGWFSGASGTLSLDPANPSAAKLNVSIPVGSVTTTSAKLTEELRSAEWLDAAKYPNATFTSTSVTKTSADAVEIMGNLTLHGVTRPVTIRAKLFGAVMNPMSKQAALGFLGRAVIHRSDFGVSTDVPLVSDETVLVINAAFEMAGPPSPAQKK